MKKLTLVTLLSSLSILAGEAFAAPTYYTDRTAFEAAAGGGLSFESFEADFASSDTLVFTGFSVSETGGSNILGQLRDFPGLVDGAITDGTGALVYDDNDNSIGTFFSFAGGITAFGLDIASNPGSTVTIGGGVSDSIVLGDDVASFWGVIDPDGITTITFDASGGPNVGFDAVAYGLAGAGADTARFYVTKSFSDGTEGEVDVTLTCNSGLPLEQDFTIEGDGPGVLFVVADIQGTETICEVTESGGPDGYTPSFNDGAGCTFEGVVSGGQYECAITNDADPAEYTVTKDWVVSGDVGEEVVEVAWVEIECNTDILTVDGDPISPTDEYTVYLEGDSDSVTVGVDTSAGPTSCSASEDVNQSGIETSYSAGCSNAQLTAGGSGSCTITNTVFFEGIPTLSQWGMALMALLMLGIGFVGLRRFV